MAKARASAPQEQELKAQRISALIELSNSQLPSMLASVSHHRAENITIELPADTASLLAKALALAPNINSYFKQPQIRKNVDVQRDEYSQPIHIFKYELPTEILRQAATLFRRKRDESVESLLLRISNIDSRVERKARAIVMDTSE